MSKLRKSVVTILIGVLIASCGSAETETPSFTLPTSSITPPPIPIATSTFTETPERDTHPICEIVNEDGKLFALSNDVFFSYGPSEEELDRALRDVYSDWANYEENVSWYSEPVRMSKIVREASFQEKFSLNSTVTLVTLGESRDWQLPSSGDLFLESLVIGERLNHLWFEWTNPENEQVRNQFPEISNAATYAIYAFFDFDQEKLEAWMQEYDKMFGVFQPRITENDCQTVIVPTATPDFCNLANSQEDIQIISGLRFTALEPGGPTLFDRILAEQNLAWADFQQDVHGEIRSAGVVFHETAFGPELGTGVNPAVLLVTYGVERNWELPINGNLVSEVDEIRAVLFQYRSDWVHGQVDPNQYPVANGATYALYRYFNGDLSKLEDWCRTYVQVYGESPLD